jgi:hypothetical protein
MRTQTTLLREQLARQLATGDAGAPQIEHLRWQIASLERQTRWREDSAYMFCAPRRIPTTPAAGRPH